MLWITQLAILFAGTTATQFLGSDMMSIALVRSLQTGREASESRNATAVPRAVPVQKSLVVVVVQSKHFESSLEHRVQRPAAMPEHLVTWVKEGVIKARKIRVIARLDTLIGSK